MSPDLLAQIERAARLSANFRTAIATIPGVIAVGAGVEKRGNKSTGHGAIVVTVRKKLSLEELRARNLPILPDAFEDMRVDVVEWQKPDQNPVKTAFARARALRDQVIGTWRNDRNVTGLGVSFKRTRGLWTVTPVLLFTVKDKLPMDEVHRQGLRPIRTEVDGFPTDVVQGGPHKFKLSLGASGSRGQRFDPLVGGISIAHLSDPFHYGTLGAVVFDAANNPMVLTNEHVLDGDIGEIVNQPGTLYIESLAFGLQLNICSPAQALRVDTPNTTAGTVLAGAAVVAAAIAACADDIDPTREGQTKTNPGAGASTLEESTKVHIDYKQLPWPGTPFEMGVQWSYERTTDAGILQHKESPNRRNNHTLLFHRLFVAIWSRNPKRNDFRAYARVIIASRF